MIIEEGIEHIMQDITRQKIVKQLSIGQDSYTALLSAQQHVHVKFVINVYT